MADAVLMMTPIKAYKVYDQTRPMRLEYVVSRDNGAQYFNPTKISLRWTAWVGDENGDYVTQSGELVFENLTSTYYPPWVEVVVPANTFPTTARSRTVLIQFTATCYYKIPGGYSINSYFSPEFFGITSAKITRRSYREGNYINDRVKNSFAWEIYYDRNRVGSDAEAWVDESSRYRQASAVLEWRDQVGGTIRSVAVSGTTQAVEIAANTFPVATSALQYRVKAVMSDGADTGFCDWMTLTTVDSKSKAQAVSPRGAYLTGNEPNAFSWSHVIETGTEQTKAELQYSSDAGQSWTVFQVVNGAQKQVVVAADTLPGASLLWRVCSYNSDGVAGHWSEGVPIVVYAAPPSPGLMPIESVGRPTLRWQAAEQQAFEVMAGTWRSGAVFGTAKQYQIPHWLSDGSIELGVRVQSALGLWSDWVSALVLIQNIEPGPLVLTGRGIENGAKLAWQGLFERYVIYRDTVIIGETQQQEWIDWRSNGRGRYQVRGVSGAFYTLSNEVVEMTRCRDGVISALEKIDWIALRVRRGARPAHVIESAQKTTLRYFSGRTLPVAEVGEAAERVHTLDYTLRREEREQLLALRALVGKTVIYKDRQGACVVGLLASLGERCDGAVDITLSIVEVEGRHANEAQSLYRVNAP